MITLLRGISAVRWNAVLTHLASSSLSEAGEIIYQPDSADDMDESDPDEDLDL